MANVNEAAKIFSVHPETIRRWIRSGKLGAVISSKKGGYYISDNALKEYLVAKKKLKSPIDELVVIDMGMPKSCKDCRFHERFNGNFYCEASSEEPETSERTGMTQYEFEHGRWHKCPLKSIPGSSMKRHL